MRTFSTALLATLTTARGPHGGINQGALNASRGGRSGYDYNIGNGYNHGNQHGDQMQHQVAYGTYGPTDMGADWGNQYSAPDAHDHLVGYDTVKPTDSDDWNATDMTALQTAIAAAIDVAQAARVVKIDEVLQNRKDRLSDIHDDNLLKIEAPFDLQLDLLEEEGEDIDTAKQHALDDAGDAWADLQERINDYLADREEALNREADRVVRALERAVDDSKPVDEVLYAMRLDWLQGVYVSGATVYYDEDVYDMGFFDSEFDLFTFDIGHGKGHGHRTGTMGTGNDRQTGMVVGARGATGSIDQLRGRPTPKGGERRRYDKATQSGHGAPNKRSDYEVGLQAGRKEGAYNYNQAADLGLEEKMGRTSRDESGSPNKPAIGKSSRGGYGYKRGMPQKRRAPKRRPSKSYRSKPSYGKRPAPKKATYRRRPSQPYQKTRQISKRTAYDDYAPMRRGGYYGY